MAQNDLSLYHLPEIIPSHPFQNILKGFFEAARIPGVGDVAAGAGVGHQKLLFSGK